MSDPFSPLIPPALADTVTGVDPANATHSAALDTDVSATLQGTSPAGLDTGSLVVVDGDEPLNGLGDLLLIAPTVELNPGFAVEADGKLTVISADPGLAPQ